MIVTGEIHITTRFDPATIEGLASFICGDDKTKFPIYRSSWYLSKFFQDLGIPAEHDGSTRWYWVKELLEELSLEELERVVLRLVDLREYRGNKSQLSQACDSMDAILIMEDMRVELLGARPVLKRALTIELGSSVAVSSSIATQEPLDPSFSLTELNLDVRLTAVLTSRIAEARNVDLVEAPLAVLILLGSTLEGILMAVALNDARKFVESPKAPLKDGKVRPITDWSMANLLIVAHDLGLIKRDVLGHGDQLRDFRNYVHPHLQVKEDFSPTRQTVDIAWQVLKAVIIQLKSTSSKPE